MRDGDRDPTAKKVKVGEQQVIAKRQNDEVGLICERPVEARQAARRGIWANLPPPPTVLKHPIAGPITLRQAAVMSRVHLERHIGQIRRLQRLLV